MGWRDDLLDVNALGAEDKKTLIDEVLADEAVRNAIEARQNTFKARIEFVNSNRAIDGDEEWESVRAEDNGANQALADAIKAAMAARGFSPRMPSFEGIPVLERDEARQIRSNNGAMHDQIRHLAQRQVYGTAASETIGSQVEGRVPG